MKVENRHILLDDEVVTLDNVTMIDVAQVGSHFDNPQFCLNVVYTDGTNREIEIIKDKTRLRVFKQLNTLDKAITNNGNDNFVNIGFALINIDNVKSIKYIKNTGKIEITSLTGYVNSFKVATNQAEHALTKFESAYNKYNQSQLQQL